MDKSAERKGLGTVIGVEQTERRSVRRRLIQSTLLPHKLGEIEQNGDTRGDSANKEDDGDGEDEDFCGSQGKRTRKHKGKTTPLNGASKKLAKEKSPRSSTPKKIATRNGSTLANQMKTEDATPPMPNLRLEAKLKAEENSRMFVGKQIHPFFSSWKAGRRNPEAAEMENNGFPVERKEKGVTIGPIHVFERVQDDVSIDWTNWTFSKPSSASSSCEQDLKVTPIFGGYVNGFKTNNLSIALHHPNMRIIESQEHNQCATHLEDLSKAFPGISTVSCDQQTGCSEIFEGSEGEREVDEVAFLPCHAGGVRKLVNEQQSRSPRESDLSQNVLWIDKYQPKSTMESMNDWLRVWRERGFQPTKDSAGDDKQNKRDDEYYCYGSDSDSEITRAANCLKNVLLVTGPVGSGKSAAIHACAKEQGFKILESNAADYRNGVLVKQKFGEALESHCLTRSLENSLESQDIDNSKSVRSIPDGAAVQEHHHELIEVTPLSDNDTETHCDRAKVKPLILFEDVDVCFPEDRGFVSAIQQIAEKAKGPVILTSNNKNHDLPNNLDRLELFFAMPSTNELLSHISLVCAAEKVDIEPGLIKQLIGHFQGDIRKTIMHLQFWFQSKGYKRARKVQNTCGSMLFDTEAAHRILPKIIPWDLPSQLSLQVENEIAKSIATTKENVTLVEVFVQEVANEKTLNRLLMPNAETNSTEAKKEAMLRRNFALENYNEYEDFLDFPCELPCSSNIPISLTWPNARRKPNIVLSSDSEDEALNEIYPVRSTDHTDNRLLFEDSGHLSSLCPNVQNDIDPLMDVSLTSGTDKSETNCYFSETATVSCMNTMCKSVDVSCVPESTIVPETEMDDGTELSSRAVSSGHFAATVEVSVNEDLRETPSPVDRSMDRADRSSEMSRDACEATAESSHGAEMEDSFGQYLGSVPGEYQVTDECSRMNLNKMAKSVEKSRPRMLGESVQESWRKLRSGHMDLKQYLDTEPNDAPRILELTCQISNVISEADLCLSRCQKLAGVCSELMAGPYQNLDLFGLYDELQQTTSNVAQQGFCFYAKDIASISSDLGFKTIEDMNWDILASTTNVMPQGSWIEQEARLGNNILSIGSREKTSLEKSEEFFTSEKVTCLLDIIKSIVPPKSYLALKGEAFHEYVSSLGCISRSDASHLSQGIDKTKKRRSRGARHYLSTGSLMLSPEDISLFGQHGQFGKTSSGAANTNV